MTRNIFESTLRPAIYKVRVEAVSDIITVSPDSLTRFVSPFGVPSVVVNEFVKQRWDPVGVGFGTLSTTIIVPLSGVCDVFAPFEPIVLTVPAVWEESLSSKTIRTAFLGEVVRLRTSVA